MKVLGTVATLVGAIMLMGGIILAQRDYQRSWSENGWSPSASVDSVSAAAAPSADQHLVMR
ncbi:MAG TPA: hypothetical protein VJN94_03990 [Candidatus Binataceae bacterium]|nr:hypothetical protein [Candidatus Binataceae bacterium]